MYGWTGDDVLYGESPESGPDPRFEGDHRFFGGEGDDVFSVGRFFGLPGPCDGGDRTIHGGDGGDLLSLVGGGADILFDAGTGDDRFEYGGSPLDASGLAFVMTGNGASPGSSTLLGFESAGFETRAEDARGDPGRERRRRRAGPPPKRPDAPATTGWRLAWAAR